MRSRRIDDAAHCTRGPRSRDHAELGVMPSRYSFCQRNYALAVSARGGLASRRRFGFSSTVLPDMAGEQYLAFTAQFFGSESSDWETGWARMKPLAPALHR